MSSLQQHVVWGAISGGACLSLLGVAPSIQKVVVVSSAPLLQLVPLIFVLRYLESECTATCLVCAMPPAGVADGSGVWCLPAVPKSAAQPGGCLVVLHNWGADELYVLNLRTGAGGSKR